MVWGSRTGLEGSGAQSPLEPMECRLLAIRLAPGHAGRRPHLPASGHPSDAATWAWMQGWGTTLSPASPPGTKRPLSSAPTTPLSPASLPQALEESLPRP